VAAGLSYLITYAEMGYSANPQKYIIKIEKQVQEIVWTPNKRKDSQTFPVEVSFQFVKVSQQEVRDKSIREARPWMWTPDIFYGFTKYANAAGLTATMVGTLAAISLF
jgi:hypothetical protein